MKTKRLAGTSSWPRGAPALAALVVAAALVAGGGPAAAAARPGGAGAPRGGPSAGVISTVAGGVGGPARATTVALNACGVSFGAGHLYIADDGPVQGGSVRAVSPGTDRLTTPAGTGAVGPLGDGGRATRAGLRQPCGVAVDRSGNLVIADTFNNRVRVVAHKTGTFYGKAMTAGDIYTVAGTGTAGFSGDGGPATKAEINSPQDVAVDAAGNLVIPGISRVRVVAHKTGTFYGKAMTAGDIYTVAGTGTRGFSGDGGPATRAELNRPQRVAVDAAGNLLIADYRQQPGPGGGGQDRHLLRPGDDRRGHLHRGRHRHRRVLRRRRPGHQSRTQPPAGGGGGRRREPADRRQRQRAGPGGGGQDRHLLRPGR